jgi:SAM-dependent methyltransferase
MARYCPEVFDATSLDAARNIILTNEGEGADTETRWALETPYLTKLVIDTLRPTESSVVIDYGCGIGRIAKELIDKTSCFVVGVDISSEMRVHARDYVASERFIAVSPAQLDGLAKAGLRGDFAIAVWVLQHCLAPAEDIRRIKRALVGSGRLFVVNMNKRAVPAVQESAGDRPKFVWANDAIDVAVLLRTELDVVGLGEPDRRQVPNMANAGAYWMSLRNAG